MAITFHQIPETYSPSDNPLRYTFSSTNTGQANFSYIVRTYYDGSLVSTDRVFPENGIYAHWNASNIVRLVASKPQLFNGLMSDNLMMKSLKVNVSESYGSPTPSEHNATDSTTTYTFKARVPDLEFNDLDIATDYAQKLFLTNSPTRNMRIKRDTDTYISMVIGTGASPNYTMRFYDSTDTLIHTYTTAVSGLMVQFNVSTSNLSSVAGVPNTDLVSYFTLQVASSEVFTFTYVEDDCYIHNHLLWINKFGCPDQFLFEHNNIISGSSKGMTYSKDFGGWSGNNYGYNPLDSGRKSFMKMVERTGTLVSGWLTQDDQNYIIELYDSPYHLILNGSTITPITIKDASYEEQQDRYEQLFNEEIKYEVSTNFNSLLL